MTARTHKQAKGQARFSLLNLRCLSCSHTVEKKLEEFHEVKPVTVNHVTETVPVNSDPEVVRAEAIRVFMMKLGRTISTR
jgi:cation transport ATPase